MKFIDLFAGLGGFHVGLERAGHTCVFACDIDESLAALYQQNFNIVTHGDIKKVAPTAVPKHEILCAGFPCQPFSKAGKQMGLKDKIRGSLIDDIANIMAHHKTPYFILENVANLLKHDNKATWDYIEKKLTGMGYTIDKKIMSPHQYGVPQHRQRLYIVGSLNGLDGFDWPKIESDYVPSITPILNKDNKSFRVISARENSCLDVWEKFLENILPDVKLPSFPIWSTEFGATYPFEKTQPSRMKTAVLARYKGSFGASLKELSRKQQMEHLPTYAIGKDSFPTWKKTFIRQNRKFYVDNRSVIDPLLKSIKQMPFSWQKFEWNCQGEKRTLENKIIQFRASGVRVKRTDFAPTLIASTATQVPIIGSGRRYMTISEAAKLQSLGNITMPSGETAAYKALGNAVNAQVVYLIAKNLVGECKKEKSQTSRPKRSSRKQTK